MINNGHRGPFDQRIGVNIMVGHTPDPLWDVLYINIKSKLEKDQKIECKLLAITSDHFNFIKNIPASNTA